MIINILLAAFFCTRITCKNNTKNGVTKLASIVVVMPFAAVASVPWQGI